ncbi:adhesion G protein-coupled receptor F4 isoform X2 [Epinephelus fuscoguttatus]|uniref:adhesion G protein-coupled receptor F4 isoform X2 n=1 Tax=Epinephelus fuscoguttatus TaxID=293821 RepID=UPI0020D0AC75|nr:adhesion G protein-coupled receptor F4 isoform X2 [Epinephelus fuscoguttatus]
MRCGVFLCLIGAVHICLQVIAAENVYIAELMVESNVTLEAQTLLSAWNKTDLQVNQAITVTVSTSELVAECRIVGDESTCNCSTGYIWSNEVCYNYNCCRETSCTQNVSHITPLCVAKVKVRITGSVTKDTLDSSIEGKLEAEFGRLNGFEFLNVTELRSGNTVTDFEAAVSIKLKTSKLQEIVKNLETKLKAVVQVETEGLYECGFTKGSVRHTAKTELKVALLPDEITMMINPLTADCSSKQTSALNIMASATILKSNETYKVWWTYMEDNQSTSNNKTDGDNLVYTFNVSVDCESNAQQSVNVTFKNTKNQEKSASVAIPVIHEGDKTCREENPWPTTPAGNTVTIQTCTEGRVGDKSRTCNENSVWQSVISNCISKELNNVLNSADNFAKGLGATQKEAKNIFEGLKNSSTLTSDSDNLIADISASITVLKVMASASENFALQEDVLPDFVNAASNMLNANWSSISESTVQQMSADYLQSVEGLVKNIKVNKTNEFKSDNLDLQICPGNDCNVSVFDVNVSLNKTNGIMKTVAVKNLMEKLNNNFAKTEAISLLLSATLEENNDSSLQIELEFPNQHSDRKPRCVFWNTTEREWSVDGCFFINRTDVNHTVCMCNHLTSFSVLMAKGDVSTDVLDIITNVGLGVSICSLLIFLIIESLVWSAVVKTNLSHFRHTAIVNISIFRLLADCSFLASSNPEKISDTWCLVLTVCKHLFYLAMFSWMLCLSVMLVHQLIFVFSPLRKRVFMFFSSIIGYVCPILIVGSSYVYCKYTDKPYYDKKKGCWLVYEKLLEGSIHAFLLPVGTVILTNLFSMVVVIFTLMKSSAPEGSKTDDKETVKSILKVVVFLTPVFGVTWIIGFAQLLLDDTNPMYKVVLYSFTILNSFQGLFILITGCFAEQKVREEVIKLIMAKSRGKSESMKNLTATTYTKEK